MENKKKLFDEVIKKDVLEFITRFNKETELDKTIDDLLYGWRILYSDVKEQCDVLLIGINPGSGEDLGARNYNLKPLDTLEYLDNRINNYELANLVKRIFVKVGLFEVLENSTMKTNTKFYATYGTDELNEFEYYLKQKHLELYNELMQNNKIWIKELINIIQPKIIIAEGKAAFQYLDDEIFTNENNDWTNTITWNGVVGAWKRNDGMVLFGFSRRRGNYDNEIAEYLKQVLN
ncbi:MAG: hypothetical protein K1X55_12530 [Chitinophagales bacterium]|nr:hypothetical protein [Chitinophagales bacterium]